MKGIGRKMNFLIKDVGDMKELRQLRNFIYSQNLMYPGYEDWVDRVCVPEIENGWKKGIIVYYYGDVVGNAIYQPHKELPRTRELKNLRIHFQLRRRDLGHFLLRQVEEENKGDFDRIILDANKREEKIIMFLQYCGYRIIGQEHLYDKKDIDVILTKEFDRIPHR